MRTSALTPLALFALAAAIGASTLSTASAVRVADPPEVTTFASCDFRTLAMDLVDGPRYAEERERLRRSLETAEIVSMRDRVNRLQEEMREAMENENRERYETLWREWDKLTDDLWPREAEIEEALEERRAKDAASAYKEVIGVVRDLADEFGYDAVVQLDSTPLEGEGEEDMTDADERDFARMMRRMRADSDATGAEAVHERFARRPIPVLPEGVDITEDVRYELGLD